MVDLFLSANYYYKQQIARLIRQAILVGVVGHQREGENPNPLSHSPVLLHKGRAMAERKSLRSESQHRSVGASQTGVITNK